MFLTQYNAEMCKFSHRYELTDIIIIIINNKLGWKKRNRLHTKHGERSAPLLLLQ